MPAAGAMRPSGGSPPVDKPGHVRPDTRTLCPPFLLGGVSFSPQKGGRTLPYIRGVRLSGFLPPPWTRGVGKADSVVSGRLMPPENPPLRCAVSNTSAYRNS